MAKAPTSNATKMAADLLETGKAKVSSAVDKVKEAVAPTPKPAAKKAPAKKSAAKTAARTAAKADEPAAPKRDKAEIEAEEQRVARAFRGF